MNRKLITALAICVALSASASLTPSHSPSINSFADADDSLTEPIQSTYLDDAVKAGGWKHNWFVGVSVGASNFLGSPLGCDDMFGRLKPTFRANIGKWFTPAVGSRVTFEGFNIKSPDLTSQGYRACHMDMMWNVAPMLLKTGYDSQWDIIPYFGVGCVRNVNLKRTPFSISYGVIGQYKLTDRLRVTAELSAITTSKRFDGHSNKKGLCDNILGLTAGINFTFGKNGWKGIVDAAPYMAQNELLLARNYSLKESNRNLDRMHSNDVRVNEELKKILRIEGLLEKYGKRIADLDAFGQNEVPSYPKNDYSGLNSLMARIRDSKNGMQKDAYGDGVDNLFEGLNDAGLVGIANSNCTVEDIFLMDDGSSYGIDATAERCEAIDMNDINDIVDGRSFMDIDKKSLELDKSWNDYIEAISSGRECIGVPVFFFFNIGSSKLTDESQLINIKEIARIAVKYGLKVKVVGAADSATGVEAINNELSMDRAQRIADELKNRGVSESCISVKGSGGIKDYEPNAGNRHTRIELYR